MKVVVTGGSGFLGSTIARKLLGEGHEVVVFDRVAIGAKGLTVDAEFVHGDVRDRDLLLDAFRGAEEVYHLAAVLGTSELQQTPKEAIETNIYGTVNVLEAANARGVQRL